MKTFFKSNAAGLIIFALGVIGGTAAAKNYFKTKYEEIAQEEIESVKRIYSKNAAPVQSDEQTVEDVTEEITTSFTEILSHNGYLSNRDETDRENLGMPYIIPPEEYGEKTGYELISLTYYADGILADDGDVIIEDMEDTVGFDSLNHFGEYEDDSVFVRNDSRMCDYEILLDTRDYTDVVKDKPYLYTED